MAPNAVRDCALELARASRGTGPDPSIITEKRRALAEAKIAAYIQKVVDAAPPLSNEQRDRLALLLRGGAA